MIITLVKADFSAKNIGTLSSFAVLTNILNATYDGPTSVATGEALNATITVADGYTFESSDITITMGGVTVENAITINDNVVTISIAAITGVVVINMATTAGDIVDIDYNGVLINYTIPDEGTWIKYEDGSDQSLSDWWSTDYIEIPNSVTTISTPDIMSYRNGTNNTTPFAFYDSDKTYLGGVDSITVGSNWWWRGMLQNYAIPSNAKYVRICWTNQTVAIHEITGIKTAMTSPEVYWGAMPEDKVPVVDVPDVGLEEIDGELIDLGTLTDKQWINMDGVDNTLANWKSTDYIEIPSGVTAMSTNDITSYRNGSANVATYAFYDDSQAYIGCIDTDTIPIASGNAAKWRNQLLNYSIPENAKYVRICYTVEGYTHAITGSTTPISELKVYWITQ